MQRGFLERPDCRIYYEVHGAGPALVFAHGLGGNYLSWYQQVAAFADRYTCVTFSHRGFAPSTAPAEGPDPERYAEDLAALIDHLALDDVRIVGQSMGGLNALTYAARPGAVLGGLVLVDVGPNVSEAGTRRIVDFVRGPSELHSIDAAVERAHAFNPARDPRLLRISLRHNLRRLPEGGWTWKYDRRLIEPEQFAAIRRRVGDMQELAGAVTCPTLVIRGADSDVLSPSDAERFAGSFADGSWATVAGAGHNVQGDNPAGLARALRDWRQVTRNRTDAAPSIRRSGSR